MIRFAGVQIVIHPIHSRFLEPFGLRFAQQAEGAANLDGNLLFDGPDGLGDFFDFAIQRAPAADDDAVTLSL